MSGVGTEQEVQNGVQQEQSDWTEANVLLPTFIKNKPSIPSSQVQSDWNEANNLLPSFIQNKPTIPAAQVNSDWNSVSGVSQILNKPTIPSIIGLVKSELLWLSNITATRNTVGGFVDIHTISYPVDANVVDGMSRRLHIIANYSKSGGNSTIGFRLVIGGVTLTFSTKSMGGVAITNDTYIFHIDLNFRSANGLYATAYYTRYHPNAQENEVIKTTAVGTWDKTISNNISLQWQTISGTATHTFIIQQLTSELL